MAPKGHTIRLLCIIPISTTGMTDDLSRMNQSKPGLEIVFIDGRGLVDCPPCVENHAQALESTRSLLPRAIDYMKSHAFHGVLVCCFSDHPLVYALREVFTMPITGILQAALQEATQAGGNFGIVTTARAWEKPLADSIDELGFSQYSAGVAATGLSPLELDTLDRKAVVDRIAAFSQPLIDNGAESIILGCAGMTVLEDDVLAVLPPTIKTVDGVRSGIDILSRLAEEAGIAETAAAPCTDDARSRCAVGNTELTSNAEQVF